MYVFGYGLVYMEPYKWNYLQIC